ncbi:RNA polymerase sigma factor [Aequorivita echinoideorum]|uniref:Sigma-70 family RNA polymerase sigma factor n=1 Tax=Aequorivita echinoideorum TaxID=1549647 RepID=A0ABS5S2U4_9FLAO|nr:sigma-70 family RNA polymerase sigma factor [Aequorivita echinoideorum]MBT0607293.1 sigma-70 family RNA polymerase sigma factor [Aequorivita echinoideorum]
MNLEKLIAQCSKNDRTAQNELFQEYKDMLYFISLKYCRNEADAEDNLHDAFIAIFQKIKTYKNKGSFEGWMKRITIYKAIDKYKITKQNHLSVKDDLLLESTEVDDDAEIKLDVLLKFIQELPDQYRLVFNLYQLDGYSHKEIATLLEISESTSKSNYHRAKLILRDKVNEYKKELNAKAI